MGFLSGLTEKIFGGTDNSAQKAQQQSNAASQAFIEEQSRLARGDANYLYPQGDYARNRGINAAMALMGRAMPYQMGAFQNGNVEAQNRLLAGMPQYQNSILGMPVDNQELQPYRMGMPDSSFYRQQLPDFGMAQAPQAGQSWGQPTAAVTGQQPQPGRPQQEQVGQLLAMMLGGGFR
jgi:hypothetical protein